MIYYIVGLVHGILLVLAFGMLPQFDEEDNATNASQNLSERSEKETEDKD